MIKNIRLSSVSIGPYTKPVNLMITRNQNFSIKWQEKNDCILPDSIKVMSLEKRGKHAYKGEDALRKSKRAYMTRNYGKPTKCYNLNCKSQCSFFGWTLIDSLNENREINNFAQLCYSCIKIRADQQIDPNWDWENLKLLHENLKKESNDAGG